MKANLIVSTLFFLSHLLIFGTSENILILGSFISGSHLLTFRTLSTALVDRGHEVRLLRWKAQEELAMDPKALHNETTLALKNENGKLPFITHEASASFINEGKHFWQNGFSFNLFPLAALGTIRHVCAQLFSNEALQKELHEQNYSLVIADLWFNDCGLAQAYKLGIPAVGFWPFHFVSAQAVFTPAFNPPSSIPQTMSTLTDSMNLFERTYNFLISIPYSILLHAQFLAAYSVIYHYVPTCPYPSTLLSNMSGMIINSNPSLDYPRLLPPTYIEAGGLHLKKPKPLPKNILDFIEGSGEEGVILFSLGILFDAKSMPLELFENFISVFARLKQRVIVKSMRRPMKESSNVMVLPILPQQDILAHNKTVLFITHCGMHGVLEGIQNEVPMIGIPIFLDQIDNIIRLQHHGVAVLLQRDSKEKEIYQTIRKVASDKRYKENVIALKQRMAYHGDPLDKVFRMLEYVIRTGGANDLKLASRNLNIFQYLCFDVILLLLSLCWLSYYLLCRLPLHYLFKPLLLNRGLKC